MPLVAGQLAAADWLLLLHAAWLPLPFAQKLYSRCLPSVSSVPVLWSNRTGMM